MKRNSGCCRGRLVKAVLINWLGLFVGAGALTAQTPDPDLREIADLAETALRDADYSAAVEYLATLVQSSPDQAGLLYRLGDAQFMNGDPAAAVASYDRVIELQPEAGPRCWQRGLALYYTGEYELGKQQFESHQTWNRQDVENAVWHMLCNARVNGLEQARQDLIPITDDHRVPMKQIHQMFAGTGSVEQVRQAARGHTGIDEETRRHQAHYADLYIGIYYTMVDQPEKAVEALQRAVANNPLPRNRLMSAVADAQLRMLKSR